jgi:hypothetical protein
VAGGLGFAFVVIAFVMAIAGLRGGMFDRGCRRIGERGAGKAESGE